MNLRRTVIDHRHASGRRRRPTQCVALESLERRDLLSADVLSYRYGATDQGLNSNETILTPSNVNATDFGKLNSTPVDGQVYAQPLYKENVNITTGPSPGSHNVVFVATMHDSLYAIDAQSGAVLWQTSFIDPAAGVTTVPSGDVYVDTPDISPEIGVLSTPVIDPATNTLYAEAVTKEIIGGQTHFVQSLHAIDLGDGSEKFGGPDVLGDTVLNADGSYQYVSGPAVDGTGPDNVNGVETFNAMTQLQRAALSLVNGTVYIAFASYGDNSPFNYHGWVLGVDAQSMATVAAFNDTPNGNQGGIWQGGGGIASDASGNLYLSTGNGTFDTTLDGNGFPAQHDYGDSVLKLAVDPNSSPANQNGNGWGLKVVDYFSPFFTQQLNANDQDLGSSAPIILPDSAGSADHPHLLLASGKTGNLFLIDRDDMGKFNPQTDLVVQEDDSEIGSAYGPAGYFDGNFYFTLWNNSLQSYTVNNALMSSPTATSPDAYAFPGSVSSISANGDSGGIVWQVEHGTSELRAYDATNVSDVLYTSDQAPAGRDQLGQAIKFSVPTVADGQVFVGTGDSLVTYGPLTPAPSQPTVQFDTASQTVNASAGAFSVTVSLSAASATDTTVPFTLGGTASGGVDYSGITASPLIIPAGQTSGTISGTLLDDSQAASPPTITFTLGTPTNATLGGTTSDTLTISETAAQSIQGTGATLVGNELSPLTGVTVATFTSGDGSAPPGVFNATVNWGDGTTSLGAVSESGTTYLVSGSHTYQDLRTYSITVNVTGNSATAAIAGGAVIHDALLAGITLSTPNQFYVAQAYVDLLDRPVDAAGLAGWSKALDQGLSRNTFTSDLTHSDEYLHNLVQSNYQRYLGRAADAQGLSAWTQGLHNGMTDEQLEADFISSDEFYAHVGGTNKAWIDSVYFEMLGRAADSAGENAWLRALAQGQSRNSVALGFAKSFERETERIQADYLRFLGRAASPAEVNGWVKGLMNGFLDEDVVAGFAASNEYYQLHSRPE